MQEALYVHIDWSQPYLFFIWNIKLCARTESAPSPTLLHVSSYSEEQTPAQLKTLDQGGFELKLF